MVVADTKTGKTIRSCSIAGFNGLLASFSPDGRLIAFGTAKPPQRSNNSQQAGQSGNAPSASGSININSDALGLYVLEIETGRRGLIASGLFTMPVWSSDGAKFAFEYIGLPKSTWVVDAADVKRLLREPSSPANAGTAQ